MYRDSQTARGLTEEYCCYLDCLVLVDISYVATWKERSRYESSLVLGVNDGLHPGPMTRRGDFPQAARKLAALQREQGRVVLYTRGGSKMSLNCLFGGQNIN